MPTLLPSNEEIAKLLETIADQLEEREDNPYRVQAFRHGAERVRATETRLTELIEQGGGEALTQLEGIGQGLASLIFEFITTGRSTYLQQLEGRYPQPPEDILQQVPGIGPELARRIIYALQIDSLEGLAKAAHNGRLSRIQGFGPRRVAAIQHSLAALLGNAASSSRQTNGSNGQPGIDMLLEVDAEYRQQAEAGALPKLAPRRNNPQQEAWLPVMQTEKEGWAMTVLFSNTARAHELKKTHDWVVIYYQKDGPEAQCTIVTETGGLLEGKRVIRGRERECITFYKEHNLQRTEGTHSIPSAERAKELVN
jgi:DNA polymerase (family X)